MKEEALAASGLFKSYGGSLALDDISFHVGQGELFGLIGPDGAGKTTLFRLLTTLVLPDKGAARVIGFDVLGNYKEIRQRSGYMPGRFSLYGDLSVEENLNFFAALFYTTLEEQYELIRDIYVQIEPFKKRRAGNLSGGMKQKLALCCALIHRPQILFLDEPTTGVDPVSRREFWTMLQKLKAQGITIVVSTPYMDEAALCDRIALMQGGKLLSVDSPEQLVRNFGAGLYRIRADQRYLLLKTLRELPQVRSAYAFGEYAHLVPQTELDRDGLLSQLKMKGLTGVVMEEAEPDIEDCFIKLLMQA